MKKQIEVKEVTPWDFGVSMYDEQVMIYHPQIVYEVKDYQRVPKTQKWLESKIRRDIKAINKLFNPILGRDLIPYEVNGMSIIEVGEVLPKEKFQFAERKDKAMFSIADFLAGAIKNELYHEPSIWLDEFINGQEEVDKIIDAFEFVSLVNGGWEK